MSCSSLNLDRKGRRRILCISRLIRQRHACLSARCFEMVGAACTIYPLATTSKEVESVPPDISKHGGCAGGRKRQAHLHNTPNPECANRGRRLHDIEIAMLIARVYQVAACYDGTSEKRSVSKYGESV